MPSSCSMKPWKLTKVMSGTKSQKTLLSKKKSVFVSIKILTKVENYFNVGKRDHWIYTKNWFGTLVSYVVSTMWTVAATTNWFFLPIGDTVSGLGSKLVELESVNCMILDWHDVPRAIGLLSIDELGVVVVSGKMPLFTGLGVGDEVREEMPDVTLGTACCCRCWKCLCNRCLDGTEST